MAVNVLRFVNILKADPTAKVLIEAEVHEEKRQNFESNYRSATGENAQPGDYYHLIDDKWGLELRLYLEAAPSTISELKNHYSVTANTAYRADEYSYRINNNELIRRLFREGFRLGPNEVSDL